MGQGQYGHAGVKMLARRRAQGELTSLYPELKDTVETIMYRRNDDRVFFSRSEKLGQVTLPPTSIQREGDSGGWFGRSGRVERRGLARSRSVGAASDSVAG